MAIDDQPNAGAPQPPSPPLEAQLEMEGSRVNEASVSLPAVGTSMQPVSSAASSLPAMSRLPSQASFERPTTATLPRVVSVVSGASTPSRLYVGPASAQSSLITLTPPLSAGQSPRGGTPQLAIFKSLPDTLRPEAPHVVSMTQVGPPNGGKPDDMPMPPAGKNRDYGTEGSEPSDDSSGEEGISRRDSLGHGGGIEFNSFSVADASFVSTASSHGGGGGGPGGYTTLGKSVFHIFKGNVGAGVFLLPTYYKDAGFILGALCVAVLGLLMVDCSLVLLRAKQSIARAEVKTYPAVVDFVLGRWFRYFTDFALVFTQFGFCTMFLQYASSEFASMLGFPYAYEMCIVATVIMVTPMTFMTDRMHLLAYASMIAGVCVVAVIAGTTVVDIQNLSEFGVAAGVFAFVPTARIIEFLAGHMFSLEGIGIVLPVENSLAPEKRQDFLRIVKYTLVCIVSLYLCFGVLGYMAYGEALRTSVLLALPGGRMKVILQCLLAFSLVFGYPIQYVPAVQLVDRALGMSIRRNRTKAYTVRVVLNILFGLFALCIGGNALNVFASFLGAFAGVHLMITMPSLLALQIDSALSPDRETMTYGQYMVQIVTTPLTWERARFFLYLLLAAFVWIGGLYFTFKTVFGGVHPPPELPTEMPYFPPQNNLSDSLY